MEKCYKIDDVGILIGFIDHLIEKEINRNLSKFNLTATQQNVLWHIYESSNKRDIFQRDLEKHLNLTNPTVTGIVKRLEEKNLIKREPSAEDARCKHLIITDRGLAVIKDSMNFGINYIEKKLTKDMTEDEIINLKLMLKKVLKNMKE